MSTARAGHAPGEAGVWVLILGDMTIFGVLFAVYSHDYAHASALFGDSQRTLNNTLGLINTILLLASSFFVARGVQAARATDTVWAPRFFGFAMLCGLGFGVDKVIEYSEKLAAGITPLTNAFYMYYYILTGIHAIHLFFGMCVLTLLRHISRKPSIGSRIRLVEGCASYWHLVDLLWIVLFPLLYLI